MKKALMMFSSLFLIIGVTACGQSDNTIDSEEDSANQEMTEDNNETEGDENTAADDEADGDDTVDQSDDAAQNQDDMKDMMSELDFDEIEVEISYGKNKEYEAEIEHHDNGDIEAEVEDEINGEDIEDDVKAFNSIFPKAKKLNISKDMEKQDVIDQVLEAFELDADYEEFEVEFTFDDGTKLSVED